MSSITSTVNHILILTQSALCPVMLLFITDNVLGSIPVCTEEEPYDAVNMVWINRISEKKKELFLIASTCWCIPSTLEPSWYLVMPFLLTWSQRAPQWGSGFVLPGSGCCAYAGYSRPSFWLLWLLFLRVKCNLTFIPSTALGCHSCQESMLVHYDSSFMMIYFSMALNPSISHKNSGCLLQPFHWHGGI